MRTIVRPLLVLALAATTLAVGAAPAAAAPSITVSPGTGLLDGQPIDVVVTGLTPGQRYLVTRCIGPDPDTDCDDFAYQASGDWFVGVGSNDQESIVANSAGTVSTALLLRRAFTIWHDFVDTTTDPWTGSPGTPVDCSVDACTVAVFVGDRHGARVAEAPITMAAEGTYVWPQASLTLSTTTVRERSVVQAAITGMSRWSGALTRSGTIFPYANRQQCTGGADPDPDDCEVWSGDLADVVSVGHDGTATSTSVVVDRHITTPNGPVDCAVAGCTLALFQYEVTSTARFPLTFSPEWAPWPSVSHFLSQAVAPVRGRPLTNPERADIAGRLASRSTEGVDALITAARAGAADPASRTWAIGEVARTYQAFFGRGPDSAGLVYWLGRLRAGASPNEMARQFGGTREFRLTYGSSSDAGVVDAAYRNTLGRAPDADGAAYWRQQLARGLSRAGLIYRFGRSAEFQNRESPRVALAIIALTLIGRGTESEWPVMAPSADVRITLHEAVADILASELVP